MGKVKCDFAFRECTGKGTPKQAVFIRGKSGTTAQYVPVSELPKLFGIDKKLLSDKKKLQDALENATLSCTLDGDLGNG